MKIYIITFILVILTGFTFAADMTSEVTLSRELEQIKELSKVVTGLNEKNSMILDKTLEKSEQIEGKTSKISHMLEKIKQRRNNYQRDYSASQKALRVYFNPEFLKKIGADYKKTSEVQLDNEFYKKMNRQLYKEYGVPEDSQYFVND